MTLCKSRSSYFGIAQISFDPIPLAPSAIWALWGTFPPQKPTWLALLPSESKEKHYQTSLSKAPRKAFAPLTSKFGNRVTSTYKGVCDTYIDYVDDDFDGIV